MPRRGDRILGTDDAAEPARGIQRHGCGRSRRGAGVSCGRGAAQSVSRAAARVAAGQRAARGTRGRSGCGDAGFRFRHDLPSAIVAWREAAKGHQAREVFKREAESGGAVPLK